MTSRILAALLGSMLTPALITAGLLGSAHTTVHIQPGISKDGRPTQLWIDAIRGRHADQDISLIQATPLAFTPREEEWLDQFKVQVPKWADTLTSLMVPYEGISSPGTVTILFGNQGGDDGFTHGTDIICIDLSAWARNYGPAAHPESAGRIQRILSHEFAHLMSNARARIHPPDLSTPLCRALFTMHFEGLGNYHSLSNKWYEPSGGLTEQSFQVLQELIPRFVDRIVKFREAAPDEEESLRRGLSAGPFRKKWGVLPVALWLKKETGNDPVKLREWVQAGPCGVLDLSRKHLPEAQANRLREIECDCPAGSSSGEH